MKTLLSFLVVVVPVAVFASDPPELQEWWRIEGSHTIGYVGYPVSFLPNFKDGKDAIATRRRHQRDWSPTWFLSQKGDTVDQFDWQHVPANIVRADLNGDGILDYVGGSGGYIRRGIQSGSAPDEQITVRYTELGSSYPYIVADINGDGYDDLLVNMSEGINLPNILFSILWGGPDLRQLKMTHVAMSEDVAPLGIPGKKEWFISAFMRHDSLFTIMQVYDDKSFWEPQWLTYCLQAATLYQIGDSIAVELQLIDSLPDQGLRPKAQYVLHAGEVYCSHPEEPLMFLLPVDRTSEKTIIEAYSLENGKFELLQIITMPGDGVYRPFALNADLNGDGYTDWYTIPGVQFYAGRRGRELDTIPFALCPYRCAGYPILFAVSDLTGDKIPDLVISHQGTAGCLAVMAGIASRTVGVEETVAGYGSPEFWMQQNYPNPVGAERQTIVPVSVQKSGGYTLVLYTLTGEKIAELFNGYLPTGSHELSINLSNYALVPGFYSLQLSDGLHTRERGLLVEPI